MLAKIIKKIKNEILLAKKKCVYTAHLYYEILIQTKLLKISLFNPKIKDNVD